MKKFLLRWKTGKKEYLWGETIADAIRSKYNDLAVLGIQSWQPAPIMFVITWKKKAPKVLVEGFTFEEALVNAGYVLEDVLPRIKCGVMVEEIKEKGRV